MPPGLLKLLSLIIIGMGILGLITGKVMAGSRGFRTNYYTRQENPVSFYLFVCIYLSIGTFLLSQSF